MALNFNSQGFLHQTIMLSYEEVAHPEDIDLCFDITGVDAETLEKEFPAFFDPKAIGKLHRDLQCHIFTFSE